MFSIEYRNFHFEKASTEIDLGRTEDYGRTFGRGLVVPIKGQKNILRTGNSWIHPILDLMDGRPEKPA